MTEHHMSSMDHLSLVLLKCLPAFFASCLEFKCLLDRWLESAVTSGNFKNQDEYHESAKHDFCPLSHLQMRFNYSVVSTQLFYILLLVC